MRNRRAIDGNERAGATRRRNVEHPGRDFLAGSRFPGDENGRVRRRGAADTFLYFAHRRADAEQARLRTDRLVERVDVRLRMGTGVGWRMGREDALEQARDIVAADRLRQVVERTQAHGGDRITATGIGGQYHDGYRRESMDAPQPLEYGYSVHVGQPDVKEYAGGLQTSLDAGERVLSRAGA